MEVNKIFEKVTGWLAAIIILFVTAAVIYLVEKAKDARWESKVKDLQVQLAHAQIPIKKDTIRDSIPVFTQQVVEIDKTDYKQLQADRETIKDLGLKLNQVMAENKMLREARDSVCLKPVNDSILRYHDHWADFEYNLQTSLLKYGVRDSFAFFITRIYKHKLLWWRWGTKGYQVKTVNFNKNVDVKYNQMLMIKK